MFFIRRSQLFTRKGSEEHSLLCHKRSEGRLKRYESCTDSRAWSLDRRERASYVLDFMSSIARADQLNKEKVLEDTSSKGQNKEKVLEDTSSKGQNKEKALEDTSSKGQVSPSAPPEYEMEYTSEVIEHVGVVHGEGVGVALQSGNLPSENIRQELEEGIPDNISESSLDGRKVIQIAALQPNPDRMKFTQIAALQANPDGGCGCGTKEESLNFSKENTFYGEHKHADMETEKKSSESIQSGKQFEETIGGEDETLPLDHIDHESFEESILNDVSKSSLHSGKFTRIAALKPNPDQCCGYSPKKELLNFSKENIFYGEQNGVSLQCADIKAEKKSDESIQSENQFEETFREEDETLPIDQIKQESFEESIVNDVSTSSPHGGKFTQIAALRPNPARNCVCSAAKELLTSSKENAFYTVSLQAANIIDKKKSATKENTFYTVSLQPVYIKAEENSDETDNTENLSNEKNGAEDETNLPSGYIKQESVAESIIENIFRSSVQGEKFTHIAASRPNPELMTLAHEYVSDIARESVSSKKEAMPKEKRTYSEHLISSAEFREHEEEVLPFKTERETYKEQMDMQSTMCSCKVGKEEASEMEYHNFASASPASSSKHSVMKERNPVYEDNPSVQYVSYSRSPTITISDVGDEAGISVKDKKVLKDFHGKQMDPQTAACSCNVTKQPDHVLKTEKPAVNVPSSKANMMAGTDIEMKGYDDSNMYSSQYAEDDISFDSESGFCKQRFHACREAKQTDSVLNQSAEIPDSGMVYYLIPVPQVQRTEFSFSEKEVKCCDSAKQAGPVVKKDSSAAAFESMVTAASEIKKEEISLPYGEVNGSDEGNMNNIMDSSQYAEEGTSFETESSFTKQHMCACREAKEVGNVSQEAAELPSCGMVYFLIPVSQVQGTEFNVPEGEGKIYGDNISSETPVTGIIQSDKQLESHDRDGNRHRKETKELIYDDNLPVNITTQEEKIKAGTVREIKSYDDSNMNSRQYVEDDISFDSGSDFCKLRFHACREAPDADVIYFDEHVESYDGDANSHRDESEKLVRSFSVERKFYKEQMDAAIRKLNDQIKEIENLRAERDSLKTDLDTAQNYIEQHKKAINKLNSMRKVDEQLSRENELLLKKIYQLSHTAFNQQTTISKLRTKLKQKSKHSSYIQNNSSNGKGSDDFKPIQILFPTSQNNLMVPHKSVFLESYSQCPLKNSTSDVATRYNNMIGDNNYSFSHINGKSAFVEHTVNHVQITAVTDCNPQNKKYLDLKKTIRKEKDDLLKVTKLIQFQQGIISNLSNCIDNEKMLLSELNSAREKKR